MTGATMNDSDAPPAVTPDPEPVADDEAPRSVAQLREDVRSMQGRLDRHRSELEQLKRRYNQLARFVTKGEGIPNGDDQSGTDRGTGADAFGRSRPE